MIILDFKELKTILRLKEILAKHSPLSLSLHPLLKSDFLFQQQQCVFIWQTMYEWYLFSSITF